MAFTLDNLGPLSVLGGACYVAPLTAAMPATAVATPSNMWTPLGRYGEDGLEVSRKRTTNATKDQWGETVFETVTEAGITYKAKFLETIKAVLENYWGTQVTSDGTQTIVPSAMAPRASFMFDTVLADAEGNRFIERAIIRVGQVVEVGDQKRKNGEGLSYDMTIRAFASSAIQDPTTKQDGSVRILRAAAPTA